MLGTVSPLKVHELALIWHKYTAVRSREQQGTLIVTTVISFSGRCDVCWRGSHDGLVISGLVFSILALFCPIAAAMWVVHSETQSRTKCEELP